LPEAGAADPAGAPGDERGQRGRYRGGQLADRAFPPAVLGMLV
jgi:hypothetical protein